jgi:hypothetical protein
MTTRGVALLWVALLSAEADTLSLRNETCVTGRLISIDATQVRFRVNGTILSYARSNVAEVNLSPEPTDTALPPVNGETIDQVLAQLGQPEVIADGEEQIYIYRHWKVIFNSRQVTDVVLAAPGASRITTGSASMLAFGQTQDDIIAVLGRPVNTVDVGRKKILIFKDLKVTFVDGKVTRLNITWL